MTKKHKRKHKAPDTGLISQVNTFFSQSSLALMHMDKNTKRWLK
jgi:hypothetical protein